MIKAVLCMGPYLTRDPSLYNMSPEINIRCPDSPGEDRRGGMGTTYAKPFRGGSRENHLKTFGQSRALLLN